MDIIDLQDGHATPKFWVLVNYIYLSIYMSMTRQFLEKRGFQKTPFPISVGLQTFFAIGLDNDMVICKVSAPNINVNVV